MIALTEPSFPLHQTELIERLEKWKICAIHFWLISTAVESIVILANELQFVISPKSTLLLGHGCDQKKADGGGTQV